MSGYPCSCCCWAEISDTMIVLEEDFWPRDTSTPLHSAVFSNDSTVDISSGLLTTTITVSDEVSSNYSSDGYESDSAMETESTYSTISGYDPSWHPSDELVDFSGVEYSDSESFLWSFGTPSADELLDGVRQHFAALPNVQCLTPQDPIISSSGPISTPPPSPTYGSPVVSAVSSSDMSFLRHDSTTGGTPTPPVVRDNRDYKEYDFPDPKRWPDVGRCLGRGFLRDFQRDYEVANDYVVWKNDDDVITLVPPDYFSETRFTFAELEAIRAANKVRRNLNF